MACALKGTRALVHTCRKKDIEKGEDRQINAFIQCYFHICGSAKRTPRIYILYFQKSKVMASFFGHAVLVPYYLDTWRIDLEQDKRKNSKRATAI